MKVEGGIKTIHPSSDETYTITFDDGCLVVSSGNEKNPKVWLSASMIRWIAKNGLKELKSHYEL